MDSFTLSGLIFMLVLGPAVGNYACSVVYRLPLGQTPFEKKPYCGHCGTMLQPIDLFPILSFLLTRGKCRYCRGTIPPIYTFIEVCCLVVFVVNFLLFSVDERFLLLTAYAVFLLITACIAFQHGFVSSFMLVLTIACIALLRVSLGEDALEWMRNAIVTGVFSFALWQITRKGRGTIDEVPAWVWMSVLAGASLPLLIAVQSLGVSAIAYAVVALMCRGAKRSINSAPLFALVIYAALIAVHAGVLTLPSPT